MKTTTMHCPHCGEDFDIITAWGPMEAIDAHVITCTAFGGSGVSLPLDIRGIGR